MARQELEGKLYGKQSLISPKVAKTRLFPPSSALSSLRMDAQDTPSRHVTHHGLFSWLSEASRAGHGHSQCLRALWPASPTLSHRLSDGII
jgi:hypothetical protein